MKKNLNSIKEYLKTKIMNSKAMAALKEYAYLSNGITRRLIEATVIPVASCGVTKKELELDDIEKLRQVYENGMKADKSLRIEREFTIFTFRDVTGKLGSWNLSGHVEPKGIKAELKEMQDIFIPVILNTSIHNKIDVEITKYRLQDFVNNEGEIVTELNLVTEDTQKFDSLLLNGAIEEVERSKMQIAGLLHYSDEVQRIYTDKQSLKPRLVKSLLHI